MFGNFEALLVLFGVVVVFSGILILGADQGCATGHAVSANGSLSVTDSTTLGLRDAHGVDIFGGGDYVAAADRNGDGVAVYDVSNRDRITLLDRVTDYTYLNSAHYVAVGPDGEYAYLGAYRHFTVVDISDRHDLDVVGHVRVGRGNQEPLVLDDSVVALAGAEANTVYTIDVSEKSDPTVLDSIGGGGAPYYMDGVRHLAAENGTLFYTADVRDEHFGALNATDPGDLALQNVTDVGPETIGNDPHEIAVDDGYAYVADMQSDDGNGWSGGDPDSSGAIHVYDVSSPSHLKRVTAVTQADTPGAYLDDVHGLALDSERNVLYAAAQSHTLCSPNSCGLNVVDVTDPTAPTVVDSLKADAQVGPVQQVDVHDDFLVTASHENTESCQGLTGYTTRS